ncbi:MAG TPA: ABC transporter ATP-binding protein [Anaerolineae bacterium]|jgi:putative ABC transport system ATP-binding protein|nr:ABC transporter ATP-binding protein [Anaerolineae bacterium]
MSSNGRPIIQVQNVFKNYPVGDSEVEVLKGVSFDVPAGQFLAIVGSSGNGKSTLLNMIAGIDHPTSGKVIVADQALDAMNENQLAAWRGPNLGIVFQFFQLLPSLSLLQNVIMPMDFTGMLTKKQRRERAYRLLHLVGLSDQVDKLPSMISGGQQQRAAIARALANDPPIVVADEPTGNLDTQTSEELFALFDRLSLRGKTLVMVTHSQALARRASRMIEVKNGLIERDLYREVSSAPQVREAAPA